MYFDTKVLFLIKLLIHLIVLSEKYGKITNIDMFNKKLKFIILVIVRL